MCWRLQRLLKEGSKGDDKEDAARIARDLEEDILRDQKIAAMHHKDAHDTMRFQKSQWVAESIRS